MKKIFCAGLILITGSTVIADDVTVKSLQVCFNEVDRENFEVQSYSKNTETLVYDVDKSRTVILKPSIGYEISSASAGACKKIDLGSLEKLGEILANEIDQALRAGARPSKFESCALALKLMKLEAEAVRVDALIKSQKSKPAPPAEGKF